MTPPPDAYIERHWIDEPSEHADDCDCSDCDGSLPESMEHVLSGYQQWIDELRFRDQAQWEQELEQEHKQRQLQEETDK